MAIFTAPLESIMPEQPPIVSRMALRGGSQVVTQLATRILLRLTLRSTDADRRLPKYAPEHEDRGIYDLYAPHVIASVRLTPCGFADLSCAGRQRWSGACRR